uniref:Uncharacterized protein n=1 Tax=viral metagenome TaxID=1070528 RepID=A0A6C0IIC9_9ZZZZ
MSQRKKRPSTEGGQDKELKRKRVGINVYIPIHKLDIGEDKEIDKKTGKIYTQEEVTTLLQKQERAFRTLLEEKLREQFNMFNQFYINNIFKEYEKNDFNYIN